MATMIAKDAPEYPKTIVLKKPIEAHGVKLTELVFNEPNGGDLMGLAMKTDEEGAFILPTISLASSMSGVPPSTIKSLGSEDTFKVLGIVGPLATRCLETLAP